MQKRSYYLINAITLYRLIAALVLLILVFTNKQQPFKWLLAISFFTDSIDGILARKFKVASIFGARLDSMADDATMLAGIVGLLVFKKAFIVQELFLFILLVALYALQTALAVFRYGKVSSFHTYLAKIAALLQGSFLILIFFLPQWPLLLFYCAASITILDLIEEIILVLVLPNWQTDVKGLYWIKRKSKLKNLGDKAA